MANGFRPLGTRVPVAGGGVEGVIRSRRVAPNNHGHGEVGVPCRRNLHGHGRQGLPKSCRQFGGEGGIRTLGRLSPTHDLQSMVIDWLKLLGLQFLRGGLVWFSDRSVGSDEMEDRANTVGLDSTSSRLQTT